MIKSIFVRLLMTYSIITILVISTFTFMISSIYKNIVFEEKKNSFESIALRTSVLTNSYLKQEISSESLNAEINGMSYSADAMIYVMKMDKKSFSIHEAVSSNDLKDDFIYRDLQKILDGKKVFRENQYSEKFETYLIFTGYPLKINGKIHGAILIFSPINNINHNISRMNYILWISAVVIFIISIPFIYLNSRKISKPILEIEAAARNIARGGKSKNIEIKSKDEIGMLTHSFNSMREQIEITENVRREFIANVSHELRTPLTSINGFVHGMIDGIIKEEQTIEYLQLIQTETQRLIHLTSDLLELAKVQSGNISLKIESLELKTVINDVISMVLVNAEKKQILIYSNIDSHIRVSMDRERLKQILINVFSNAVKYTPPKGKISVSAEIKNHIVEIAIRDNGMGIPEEDIPYLFDRFYRSNHNLQEESTGLGLSIVKNLVVLSGGTVRIESKLGQGTCIYFTLIKAEF